MPKDGDLRVWWIPQVPMKAFNVDVETLHEAAKILDVLAEYDLFQLICNVKPDYTNAGGLHIYENGEWCEWYDEDSGEDIDGWAQEMGIGG